mmetsp:Transcript_911/g.1874  ORF Transcript_911/g.1874 Transcript_911/m.1874 type:complete len:90 (+) Transcript_911:381-650(+)
MTIINNTLLVAVMAAPQWQLSKGSKGNNYGATGIAGMAISSHRLSTTVPIMNESSIQHTTQIKHQIGGGEGDICIRMQKEGNDVDHCYD